MQIISWKPKTFFRNLLVSIDFLEECLIFSSFGINLFVCNDSCLFLFYLSNVGVSSCHAVQPKVLQNQFSVSTVVHSSVAQAYRTAVLINIYSCQ